MTSPSAVPPGDTVSDYYSSLGPLLQMAWDDNFHFGYWDGPSDTSSVQEATDRFTDLLIERLRVGPGPGAGCRMWYRETGDAGGDLHRRRCPGHHDQ